MLPTWAVQEPTCWYAPPTTNEGRVQQDENARKNPISVPYSTCRLPNANTYASLLARLFLSVASSIWLANPHKTHRTDRIHLTPSAYVLCFRGWCGIRLWEYNVVSARLTVKKLTFHLLDHLPNKRQCHQSSLKRSHQPQLREVCTHYASIPMSNLTALITPHTYSPPHTRHHSLRFCRPC